ncbi:MAG: MFS transporter [Candidatus Limnocylindria bacterium]
MRFRLTTMPAAAEPEPADEHGLWTPERRPLTVGLVSTVTLIAFEALAVATVMPLAGRELGTLALYGWAFTAFFLASMLGIVGAGVAVDRYGVRLPFVTGVTVFALGLAVGGLALSMPMLVAGRAIQGVGGGVLTPVAYVIIARGYPDAARPKMFAILSSAWVVPALVGPAVAGTIGDHLSWRIVFLGLLPIIAAAGGLTMWAIRRQGERLDAARQAAAREGVRRLGRAIVVAAATALLLAGLSDPLSTHGPILAVAGVAVGLPAISGLLPAGTLVARAGLPAVVLARGALTFGFFSAGAYLPLAMVSIRGTTAFQAGLAVTASALSWTLGSWIQARRNASWGERRLVQLGFAAVFAGIALTAAILVPGIPVYAAVVTWAIGGLGMGMAYSSISLLVLRGADPAEQGRATAALSLSEVIGTSIGTGLGGAAVAAATVAGWPEAVGVAGAFLIAALAAAAGLLLTARLPGRPRVPRPSLGAVESLP